MAASKSVSVTREELRVLQSALKEASLGSDAEVNGHHAADERAARACQLLADFIDDQQDQDRGADVIVALDGVPILVEVVLEANSKRMMESLMGAVAGVIPRRKVYALRALVEIASVERHRGPVRHIFFCKAWPVHAFHASSFTTRTVLRSQAAASWG